MVADRNYRENVNLYIAKTINLRYLKLSKGGFDPVNACFPVIYYEKNIIFVHSENYQFEVSETIKRWSLPVNACFSGDPP